MQGQLLVTGVSPRPEDVTGEQFVTITGVINGPTVNEHVIYQRMAVDVDRVADDVAALSRRVLAEKPGQLAIRADRGTAAATPTRARGLLAVSAVGDAQQVRDAGQLYPWPSVRLA